MNENKLTIIELFAGVGGFRLGLEGDKKGNRYFSPISGYKDEIDNPGFFKTGYANQFEPSRRQFAAEVYRDYYKDSVLDNRDIAEVKTDDILKQVNEVSPADSKIMLVGGFPCQDYSVANGLHTSKGLVGNKGVLWWEIHRLIKELRRKKRQPEILLLENVDRLLVSPAKQRGRDFAIMLFTLNSLGYTVEYKVVNAAEYDFPQKRKRVFILAYLKSSPLNHKNKFHSNIRDEFEIDSARSLDEIDLKLYKNGGLVDSLSHLEKEFQFKKSPFGNAGILRNYKVYPFKEKGSISESCKTLGDILENNKENIPTEYRVKNSELKKWKDYRGQKSIERLKPNGETYYFKEGSMNLYDSITSPSRTIITSEGGKSASRTKHLIKLDRGQSLL